MKSYLDQKVAGRTGFALVGVVCILVTGASPVTPATAAETAPGKTGGYKITPLTVPTKGGNGLIEMLPRWTGINFTNIVSNQTMKEHRTLMNAGLAAGDVNGDGLCDLYICSVNGPNALYLNRGNWKFEEMAAKSGVACAGQLSMGAVFADVDGDGDLDLLVLGYGGPNRLFLNDGKGRFTEDLTFPGRESKYGSVSAAFADIDGNGTLDLYIANHRFHSAADLKTNQELFDWIKPEMEKFKAGKKPSQEFLEWFTPSYKEVDGRMVEDALENGEPDVLYLNDGKGHFRDVTNEEGRFLDEDGQPMDMPRDWSLSVQFRDLNGDGSPDIYVCSDFSTPDRIWLNDSTGHFRLAPKLTLRHTSQASMGVDFADINRDGLFDFFTVEMLSRDHARRKRQMGNMRLTPTIVGSIDDRPQYMQNTLFLNRGDGTFAEIAMLAGVKASEWSWSPIFVDIDLDGYEDLIVGTGMVRDYMDADTLQRVARTKFKKVEDVRETLLAYPKLATPNFIFRNRGDLTFEEISEKWGFRGDAITGGMVVADFDGDGDLDVVMNTVNTPAKVYQNVGTAPRVSVRLKGKSPNTQGIGAHLILRGGPVTQMQDVIAGGHYASGSDPLRVFAAGQATGGMTLEVTWRNGTRSVVHEVKANTLVEVDEADAQPVKPEPVVKVVPLFTDVSAKLNHVHRDNSFDDFARQPLLPNRLSQLGPGVAWFDIDRDGFDDLIIGSGKLGTLSTYRNDGQGGFAPVDDPIFTAPADQTTVLGWTNPQGKSALLIGSSNFESGSETAPSVLSFDSFIDASGLNWKPGDGLPGQISSTGPLAMVDVDGDGRLDLFVGGRTVPGRYPEPAASKLYRNDGEKFILDEKNSALFASLGLVSGAVFGDLNGDGWPDLVVACEWGPVRVFLNQNGVFKEATQELGLDKLTGWWNGVTLGDFDGDGRLDIAASNWGRNSKYEGAYGPDRPLEIYYDDFDNNGTLDIVEAHVDLRMGKLVPERGRSCTTTAMPYLRSQFPTFAKFGSSTLEDIYGDKLKRSKKVQASVLEHTVFLNRGNKFEPIALPIEAQFAPGFGICVADFDGDGKEDIFLAQNFFAVQIETPRNDGGRGLLLKGDSTGHFTSVSGQESGIKVYGEQRGAALCDYDRDGRVDIAVTQNGAETKLYHNTNGKPGLRVRLKGAPGNRTGVGALMRLVFGDHMGPARVVTAGSGYWSQDSAVQVLARPETPTQLWVRWPGGKETTSPVPANAREISVTPNGEVKMALQMEPGEQSPRVAGR